MKKKNSSVEAEAAFAAELYKDRAALNRKAEAVLAAGSRQVTIRLDNSEIALARKQAKEKGLRYQTYVKMLLHQALIADR
jgi:predicted DNA binding CopG/RHH family protein